MARCGKGRNHSKLSCEELAKCSRGNITPNSLVKGRGKVTAAPVRECLSVVGGSRDSGWVVGYGRGKDTTLVRANEP